MKKKHRKSSGVKASGSGQSKERTKDRSELVHFNIRKNTNLNKLKQDLLRESKKNNPNAILLLIHIGFNFSFKEIEKFEKYIIDNKINVTVRAIGNVDFTVMAMVIFLSTYHTFFSDETSILMRTFNPITEAEIKRIIKRISKIMVCDEKELMKYYKEKAMIAPSKIFEKEDEGYVERQNMNPIQIDGSYYKRR